MLGKVIDLVLLLVVGTDSVPIMFRVSIIIVSASFSVVYHLIGSYWYLILDGYALESYLQ